MTVTVTVPATMSSDGTVHIYTDDSNPTTGLDGGGHVTRLLPLILDNVYITNYAVTQANAALTSIGTSLTGLSASVTAAQQAATAASASAIAAANSAATITATSTVSYAIGTGSKSFPISTGKQFQPGQNVTISDISNPANFMFGQVTSYSGSSLVVNVTSTGGSGTITNWNISLSGVQGATGAQGTVPDYLTRITLGIN